MDLSDVKFYVVRDHNGKYYENTTSWKDFSSNTRIFTKAASARHVVTTIAIANPDLPMPELVIFHSFKVEVVTENQRLEDAIKRIDAKKERQRTRNFQNN